MNNCIFIVIIICLSGCFSKDPLKTNLEGKPLPSFNILLLDSSAFNTKNVPDGKPTALLYFGPYCPYSRSQMEEILKNNNLLSGIQFYIFTSFPLADLKKFYSYFHLEKFPNIISGVDTANYFVNYFDAKGVPYMAIYGKDKKLKKAFIGEVDAKQIKETSEE
jgi:thiol-disulfide isomerase/thioredoxin